MSIVIRKRLCLCCGAEGSTLYRTVDGRMFSACDKCAYGCEECVRTLNNSTRAEWSELEQKPKQIVALFPEWAV